MSYKIILDAGHGGDDPGAVYQGRQEKDDNLRLAMAVGQILEQNGIDVVYTRDSDIYQTPFQKAQIANQSGADFFISFHRNSSPMSNQYSGIETLVYDKSGIKNQMAENINGAVSELGFKDLGVKARPGLVVLRRTNMPALLIETGFINNDEDNELFDQQFNNIATAIASAILGTLDMELVTNPLQPTPMPAPMPQNPMSSAPGQMPMQQNPMPQTQSSPIPGQPMTTPQRNISQTTADPPRPNRPMPGPGRPPVSPRPEEPELYYRVQGGAFRSREYADNLLYELNDKGYPAFILFEDGFYKVQVGAFRNLGNAIRMEQRLRADGYATWITT